MAQPRKPKKKKEEGGGGDEEALRPPGGGDEEAVAATAKDRTVPPQPAPAPAPARAPVEGGAVRPGPPTNGESVVQDLAVARERLDGITRERDRLSEVTVSLEQRLAQSTSALADAQRDLGRLEEVVMQRNALTAERDGLQVQLKDLQTLTDQRVQSAVRSAVDKAQTESRATVAALTGERDALQKRVAELQGQVKDTGTTSRVTPTALATRFATMLEQVGAERPTDRPFAAALTSLEVEAKAILEAPREGEDEPVLRTVESGDVKPEQLSTVRMSFRLLPQAAPPAE